MGIIYIHVDELPKNLHDVSKIKDKNTKGNRIIDNTLMIEHNQRNSIVKGLADANDDDLIIVSDVDEIPNLQDNSFSNVKERLIHFKLGSLIFQSRSCITRSYNEVSMNLKEENLFILD